MAANNIEPEEITAAIQRILKEGSSGVLLTVLASAELAVGAKLLVKAAGESIGDLGNTELNDAAVPKAGEFLRTRVETVARTVGEFAAGLERLKDSLILFERIETEPRIVIAGAGHVGASLARLASIVGYRITLIDDRAEFVARELFKNESDSNIELVTSVDWSAAVRQAVGDGRGVSVAIVTRGHKQDEECLRAAVDAMPDYIGMIGSKRRTNIVLDKLREEGFPEEKLRQVRAPIGLDIGAVSPEEVALAILAEIVAEKRAGSGNPLSDWRRL
jgi:xanthine dehydrogenase accessory factor